MRNVITAVLFIILAECGTAYAGRPPIMVYDNHGGVAYGGFKLQLYASGEYSLQVYDDTGSRSLTKGRYELDRDTITLISAKGRGTYHRVLFEGGEYLLGDESFKQYTKSRDPAELHSAMRRSD